jgi:hypothetical protein
VTDSLRQKEKGTNLGLDEVMITTALVTDPSTPPKPNAWMDIELRGIVFTVGEGKYN